jgi:hypothetical protein
MSLACGSKHRLVPRDPQTWDRYALPGYGSVAQTMLRLAFSNQFLAVIVDRAALR